MFLNYNSLKKLPTKYDNKTVGKLILFIRKTENQSLCEKSKKELFLMMNKVIVKNIDNFHFLFRGQKNKHIFSEDELISESYIAFNQCIIRFGVKKDSEKVDILDENGNIIYDWENILNGKLNFYFFYNMSVMRKFQKLIDLNYRKHEKTVTHENFSQEFIEDNFIKLNKSNKNNFDLCLYDMKNLSLNPEEKKVFFSVYNGLSIKDFTEKYDKITRKKYKEIMLSLQEKIEKINEEQF
jgi:hypothetical protein